MYTYDSSQSYSTCVKCLCIYTTEHIEVCQCHVYTAYTVLTLIYIHCCYYQGIRRVIADELSRFLRDFQGLHG